MDARTAGLIERNVERGASSAFGAASAFAFYAFARGPLAPPVAVAAGAIALFIASLGCNRLLRSIGVQEPHYELPVFDASGLEVEPAEAEPAGEEPLELEDVLPEPPSDSRVVRMFAPEAMPTQIDRNLRDQHGRPIPDAAQDLYQALADLRRSLR